MKIKLPETFFPDKEYLLIVAVDPGETIGVAAANLIRCGNKRLPGKPTVWDLQVTTDQLNWLDDVVYLRDHFAENADVLIVEDWRLRKDTAMSMVGQVLYGPQVIGFLNLHLHYANYQDKLVWQQPAQKEGLDTFIQKRIDWPRSEHERDALRHLVAYLLGVKKNDS